MTAINPLVPPSLQLPWSSTGAEDSRFKKIVTSMLGVLLVISLMVPFIPVPEVEREKAEQLPPQLTKVMLEKKELPKPVVEKPKPIEPEPEPPKPKDKPKKKPKKEKPKEKPKPAPVIVETAREQAKKSGVLQFQDDLQSMRDSLDMSKMRGANITQGAATAKQLDRSVITSQAKVASGGINTAQLSRDVGGVALSGRETTKVDSKLASATGTNPHAADPRAKESSARSVEAVRKVMDQNQGAIFSIYNRALRSNPALQGKVVVKLVIEPSGAISKVALVSSELNDPALERKLLARIRLINFGADDVTTTTLDYTFDFLPY